ncbi:hypothetical protein [Saccharothrix deserti]|uniref:hypothetical protein n=1 Tax=Saccharothrix deserti TaxID=2593674 RepID=UPI00131CBB43|nr:hypothetical protein [Saccharothrix deserti]
MTALRPSPLPGPLHRVRRRLRARWKTRTALRSLLAGLLATTAVVAAFSWAAFDSVHDTIDTVDTRTSRALLAASAAKSALVEADQLAINSFVTGEARLSGPGDRYQNRIAAASQSLAQVAEDNVAGDAGSEQIQVVEGLLVAYTGWIGQADAHHRQDSGLATIDLWYASRLLHAENSGVLAQLDQLVRVQRDALDSQLAESSTSPWRTASLAVPVVLLFGLLVGAQVFHAKRFRRVFNPALLLATVVLAAVCVITGHGLVAQHRVEGADGDLRALVGTWENRTSATAAVGQQALSDLVTGECRGADGGCGYTVTEFISELRAADAGTRPTDLELTRQVEQVNDKIAAANGAADLELLIPAGALLIAVLVWLGFLPRLEEYRHRRR